MKNETLKILYEDSQIIVCKKPAGIPTQTQKLGTPDMVSLLKNHLAACPSSKGVPYLAVIHRLDQPVAGILVFAKTPAAAKDLNKQLQNQGFGKYYRALVANTPSTKEGTLENYMVKDARTNTSRICSAKENGSKIARLHYDTVPVTDWLFTAPAAFHGTELEIHLDTGRHHQIRVQLASVGCPIVGDTKYNQELSDTTGWQTIRLCAYKLDFKHPITHKTMHFQLANDPV